MRFMKVPLILLLILFLSLPLAVPYTALSSSFILIDARWGTAGQPYYPAPGDVDVPLTVVLQYVGSESLSRLYATLSLPEGLRNATGGSRARAYYGSAAPNMIFELTFRLKIDEDAEVGDYRIPVRIEWVTTSNSTGFEDHEFSIRLEGRPDLRVSASTEELDPGTDNLVRLEVDNVGSGKALDVVAIATASPQVAVFTNVVDLGDINPGSKAEFNLGLYVPPGLAMNVVSVTVKLLFKDGYGVPGTIVTSLSFKVSRVESARLSVSVSPQEITSGYLNDVTLTIANVGGVKVEDLEVSVTFQQPLALVGSDGKWFYDGLEPGESTSIPMRVYSTRIETSIVSTMLITLSYYDERGTFRSEVRQIGMMVSPTGRPTALDVVVEPIEVRAGETNELVAKVTCRSGPLSDVQISIASLIPQITLLSSDKYVYSSLNVNQTVKIPIKLYVSSMSSATGQIQFTITYIDPEGNLVSDSRRFGLLVRSRVDIKVTDYSVVPSTVQAGRPFSVTVTLTNLGTGAAYNVIAIPKLEGTPFSLVGSSSVFIGEVRVNTLKTFTISLYASSDAKPGKHVFKIRLSYTDNLRKNYTYDIDIQVEVTKPAMETETETPSGLFSQLPGSLSVEEVLIVLVVVVVIAVVVFLILRRRR